MIEHGNHIDRIFMPDQVEPEVVNELTAAVNTFGNFLEAISTNNPQKNEAYDKFMLYQGQEKITVVATDTAPEPVKAYAFVVDEAYHVAIVLNQNYALRFMNHQSPRAKINVIDSVHAIDRSIDMVENLSALGVKFMDRDTFYTSVGIDMSKGSQG